MKNNKKYFLLVKATILSLVILQISCQTKITDSDWAQFKKDNFRSAVTRDSLSIVTLSETWSYKAKMPVPAWYGPAKEDAYARSGPLPSMRDYDLSYYPIIVGNRLFYGSTSDHALHCLNAKTGEEDWVFHTGGSIRIAPTYYGGIVYFGSDDGYVYAVKARNGQLVWKYSPTSGENQKVINNQHLISFWPIRTGVLIDAGKAYFGASLLPWNPSYLCSVDAKTGKLLGKGTYLRSYKGLTMEGVMVASKDKIIQPQGRTAPMFFQKNTGEKQGQIAGTGGCFVLVTPDNNVVHGQSSRSKSLSETYTDKVLRSEKDRKDADYMSFKGGKEIVVKDSVSYVLTDTSLAAYHRKNKRLIWLRRNYRAHRIIATSNALIVGATDKVIAVSLTNGLPLWQAPVRGTVYALSVARNSLYVSTGEGYIYCFKSGNKTNPLYALNRYKPAQVETLSKQVAENEKKVLHPLVLSVGPLLSPLTANRAEIYFETREPSIAKVHFVDGGLDDVIDQQPKTKHSFIIDGFRKGFSYHYQIEVSGKKTDVFEFDNFFNFESSDSGMDTKQQQLSNDIKKHLSLNRDFAVFFGTNYLDRAIAISQQKRVVSLIFEKDMEHVQDARSSLYKKGLYGHKVLVYHISGFKGNFFDLSDIAGLVYAENQDVHVDKVIQLLKPNGKALLKKSSYFDTKAWFDQGNNTWQVTYTNADLYAIIEKKPYETAGKWTHQYGLANNTAFGGEGLWGSTDTEDFKVQWLGRPGPRFQTDRNGRKPSPLSVAGKMFVQGNGRIVAVDAYNGSILWSKSIPRVNRMNVVRDCSNWATDERYLYVVLRDRVLQIDHNNGKMINSISFPKGIDADKDWGYVALTENNLIGSVTPKGAGFSGFHGGEGWYDATKGSATDKVVSHRIFSKDKKTLRTLWNYGKHKHYIINPTITLQDGALSFLMSKNPRLRLTKEKRADPSIFKKLYLVSLDVNTGTVLFEKPIKIKPGVAACFMAANNGYNIVVCSNNGYYYIYAYGADSGNLVWKQKLAWPSDNHGGHLSKPAIVGNRLIVKPGVYDLRTGVMMNNSVPKAGHGCASYSLSEQSIFYRGYTVTQYNFDTKRFTQWSRLRPDCWLSTIPAQGMVLSPEAGGGCSCGEWLETSIVFAPKSRAPIMFRKETIKDTKQLLVKILPKSNIHHGIYYTLDGTLPTRSSMPYKNPIKLDKSTTLKAVIYLEKQAKVLPFVRSRVFNIAK